VSEGFRLLALDDTGRESVDVTDSFTTEETTMQQSGLAMAVGALCRPGGLTPENQRRVEEAILAPRTVDRSAADAFHDHLDVCKQCRENPFSLCRVGLPLLTATMAKPAPHLSPEAPRACHGLYPPLAASCTLPAGHEGEHRADGVRWPEATDAAYRRPLSPEAERQQAIRLAREAYEAAEARRRLADRETMEAELALREIDGREGEVHTRYLRAYLAGDKAGVHAARVTGAAENFIKYGWRPSDDLNADEVTAEVDRIRTERENAKH
jgi:hypothetical protein